MPANRGHYLVLLAAPSRAHAYYPSSYRLFRAVKSRVLVSPRELARGAREERGNAEGKGRRDAIPIRIAEIRGTNGPCRDKRHDHSSIKRYGGERRFALARRAKTKVKARVRGIGTLDAPDSSPER